MNSRDLLQCSLLARKVSIARKRAVIAMYEDQEHGNTLKRPGAPLK